MIVRPLAPVTWDEPTLRRAGTLTVPDGGSQEADAALDGAFAATPVMLDGF